MELQEVLSKIKEPEKLINPTEVDELLFWVSSWIGDYEEQLASIDQVVANKRIGLIEVFGSVASAEAHLKVEKIYIEMKDTERMIRQLKAFKSNLRRRYDILTNQFR